MDFLNDLNNLHTLHVLESNCFFPLKVLKWGGGKVIYKSNFNKFLSKSLR